MNKRNTLQKQIVYEAVLSLANHPTADEVFAFINKEYPSLSRSTVYRNLQSLCEDNKLARRIIPDSPDRYDHLVTNHYHIKCTICGKVMDSNIDFIHGLETKLKDTSGYVLTGHNIVFEGICPDCQKKLKSKK